MTRLLLLSNSTNHGERYLDHAIVTVLDFFGPRRRLAFVPFALLDHVAYAEKVRARLEPEGFTVTRVTPDAAGAATLDAAECVFVGGGNTFRLLDRLQRSGLVDVLRRRALAGMPYLGASAGTNVTAPRSRPPTTCPSCSRPRSTRWG